MSEQRTATIIGISVLEDSSIVDDVCLFGWFSNDREWSVQMGEPITIDHLRAARNACIGQTGNDPDWMRIGSIRWDEIEEMVSALDRPIGTPESIGGNQPSQRLSLNPEFEVDFEPPRPIERQPTEGTPSFFPERGEGRWSYAEGDLRQYSRTGSIHTILQVEVNRTNRFGGYGFEAVSILNIPATTIVLKDDGGRNEFRENVDWGDSEQAARALRKARVRIFKHVSAWLKSEFERHRALSPNGLPPGERNPFR